MLLAFGVLVSRPAQPSAQLRLGNVFVPKEQLVVFLFLGHSNMGSALAETCPYTPTFEEVHPRIWNFSVRDTCNPAPHHTWIPASAPVHVRNIIPERTYGPAMPFLRGVLAGLPEGYHVGVIQNAEGSARLRGHYLDDRTTTCKSNLWSQIEQAVRGLDTTVTWGGVVTMLGLCERSNETDAKRFAADMVELAARIRILTRTPDLPFLVTQYEEGATGRYAIDQQYGQVIARRIDSLPLLLPHMHIISTDWSRDRERFMGDDHHFNCLGHRHWAHLAVRAIQLDGSLPMTEMDLLPPSAPGSPQLDSVSCTAAAVSWGAATDDVAVSHYQVVYPQRDTFVTYSPSIWLDSLPAADSVSAAVRAVDFAGRSSPFVQFSFDLADSSSLPPLPPPAPLPPRCVYSDSTTLLVAWNSQTPIPPTSGFAVYLSDSLIATCADSSYRFVGLRPATAYHIAVSALSADSIESSPSPAVACTTLGYPQPTTALRLLSPGPGDTVQVGTTVTIRWEADSCVGSADIYLSADSGRTWLVVNTEGVVTPSDPDWGTHPWRVPPSLEGVVLTNKACVLRIQDYDGRFTDQTDGYFVVAAPGDGLTVHGPRLHAHAHAMTRGMMLHRDRMRLVGHGSCMVRLLRLDGRTLWRARLTPPDGVPASTHAPGLYLVEVAQRQARKVYPLLIVSPP
jgi:hypothetical protein